MKNRVSSKISVVSKPSGFRNTTDDSNDFPRNRIFTFANGDRYEGEYRIYGEQQLLLVRQGRGVYHTDDFNRYEGTWDRDGISSDLHIRFNNGMEYKGGLDKYGNMSGPGVYFLPDGSSIGAIWNNNKPTLDIRYEEPRGFIWAGELSADGDEIRFTSGNHFWSDMYVPQENTSVNEVTSEFPWSGSQLPKVSEANLGIEKRGYRKKS